jgi:hypothetical protein
MQQGNNAHTARGQLEDLVEQLLQFGVLALPQRDILNDEADNRVGYITFGCNFRNSLQN